MLHHKLGGQQGGSDEPKPPLTFRTMRKAMREKSETVGSASLTSHAGGDDQQAKDTNDAQADGRQESASGELVGDQHGNVAGLQKNWGW